MERYKLHSHRVGAREKPDIMPRVCGAKTHVLGNSQVIYGCWGGPNLCVPPVKANAVRYGASLIASPVVVD